MANSLPCAAETQHYKAITLQFKKKTKTKNFTYSYQGSKTYELCKTNALNLKDYI